MPPSVRLTNTISFIRVQIPRASFCKKRNISVFNIVNGIASRTTTGLMQPLHRVVSIRKIIIILRLKTTIDSLLEVTLLPVAFRYVTFIMGSVVRVRVLATVLTSRLASALGVGRFLSPTVCSRPKRPTADGLIILCRDIILFRGITVFCRDCIQRPLTLSGLLWKGVLVRIQIWQPCLLKAKLPMQ